MARAEDAAPVSATAAPSLASHKSGSTSTDPSPAAEAGPAVVQEKYEYQAEVARLMDIIINSLCVYNHAAAFRPRCRGS